MMSKTLHERLYDLKDRFYETTEESFVVIEEDEEGEAEVHVHVPGYSILLKLEGNFFPFLKSTTCADAIIFQRCADWSWKLHIIECKTTVNPNKFGKVKLQFEGALQRAEAVKGILGIHEFAEVKLYVAFRHDKLMTKILADSSLIRQNLGYKAEPNYYSEWFYDKINLPSLKEITHHKIKLDAETGKGEVSL